MNVIARDKVSKQSQPACGGLFLTFLDYFVPPEADHGGLLAKTTEGTFSTAPLTLFFLPSRHDTQLLKCINCVRIEQKFSCYIFVR